MNIETFFETVLTFIKNSENVYFLVYSVLAYLLTQLVKKIFVDRVKVEILHKFNIAVFLPFIFAVLFAVIDKIVFAKAPFSLQLVYTVAIEGAGIGAMASVIYKFIHSLAGNSLTQLLKDDVFGIFYHQLVYFGTVKQQLQEGKLTLQDFLTQVKVVASNAKSIYSADNAESVKRQQLTELLSGIITTENLNSAISVIHKALISQVKVNTDNNSTTATTK